MAPSFTAKRIQDRSMISSIQPKLDDRFFADLFVLDKLWTWNCSASSGTKQFHVHKTCKSTKNQSSNSGFIKETSGRSRFLLGSIMANDKMLHLRSYDL